MLRKRRLYYFITLIYCFWTAFIATPWWRHQMETFSALLALCAGTHRWPVNSLHKGQNTWSFDVFFDLRLIKRLSKRLRRRWFETPSPPSWRHCNADLTPYGFAMCGDLAPKMVVNKARGIFLYISHNHYRDVIMSAMVSQITGISIVYSTLCSGAHQEHFKASRHWPLWGKFTGDRWVPRTKGQYHGKCFHLMTSSWFRRNVGLSASFSSFSVQ